MKREENMIFCRYIDSHCPYLLFGETTAHLTIKWRGTLLFGETTSHLTIKWRGTFQKYLF